MPLNLPGRSPKALYVILLSNFTACAGKGKVRKTNSSSEQKRKQGAERYQRPNRGKRPGDLKGWCNGANTLSGLIPSLFL